MDTLGKGGSTRSLLGSIFLLHFRRLSNIYLCSCHLYSPGVQVQNSHNTLAATLRTCSLNFSWSSGAKCTCLGTNLACSMCGASNTALNLVHKSDFLLSNPVLALFFNCLNTSGVTPLIPFDSCQLGILTINHLCLSSYWSNLALDLSPFNCFFSKIGHCSKNLFKSSKKKKIHIGYRVLACVGQVTRSHVQH